MKRMNRHDNQISRHEHIFKGSEKARFILSGCVGTSHVDESPDYDGVTFGSSNKEPVLWIWDESKRGRANEGAVCRVFHCDDHDKTYEELKQKGVDLDSPKTAVWGGKRALCEGSGRKYRFDSVGFTKSLMGYI
jgi:hypothetical protein